MHRLDLIGVRVPLEHGKIHHPEVVPQPFRDEPQAISQVQAQAAQRLRHHRGHVGHQQQQIVHLGAHRLFESFDFFGREELRHRRLQLISRHLEVSQSLGAKPFGELGQFVQLAARETGGALHIQAFHLPAGRQHAGEGFELGVGEDCGQIHEFHAEAGIGFVAAKARHRLGITHARERGRHLHADDRHDAPDQAFHQFQHIVALHEGHLQVNLRVFELAVAPQVLITQAARELIVPLDAGDHQRLFEQLRALRQRVELAGAQARRHQEVARAFRGGLDEQRRLDFQKALFVQIFARRVRHLVTQRQVAQHAGVAQVQIAITQAQVLIHLGRVLIVDGERGRLRGI
ncbi:MAG: hypothetical protein BWY76_02806 [bacterium ADurb.Bin429]|nr:MAG: hypothetical protein BWY76_02806 [bacterium ADurb.Bin429]